MEHDGNDFLSRGKQLKSTQLSINEFSEWIIQSYHRSDQIIRDWYKWIDAERTTKGLTKILYTANDVIQNGRRTEPKIAMDMLPVIEAAIKAAGKLQDKGLHPVVMKLLKLWQDRTMYDMDQIKQLGSLLKSRTRPTEERNAPRSPKGEPHIPTPKKVMKVAYDAEAMGKVTGELTHLLGQLADPPSANLDIRMKISDFPPHIGNVDALSFIKNYDQARKILADVMGKESLVRDYCRSLSQEVMNRRQKLNLLEECLKHVRATSDRYVEQMQWLKLQKELVLAEKEKIEAAHASLPDDEEVYGSSTVSLPTYEALFIPPVLHRQPRP
ncbi:unnamed protein product, partial [Mesorhabditis belari]|uniref:CID domain-containing protein n=1 Tax=Mesorhabditis belari TaxID=2138241 RepID=A0AAF3E7X1_9BILA